MRLTVRAMLLGVALSSTAACTALQHSEPAAPVPTGLRHQLTGTIVTMNGGPIASAKLTVLDGSDSGVHVASDSTGHYAFSSLSSGRFTMTIQAPGHEAANPIVDLTRDLSVDFALRKIQ
jgi:hypothetical protein